MSEHFGPDVEGLFDVERSLESRAVVGGTSSGMLLEQLAAAEAAILSAER